MDYVKAINYTGFNYHCIGEEKTKENLCLMKKCTGGNTIIIVLGALQDEPFEDFLDCNHSVMPTDPELIDFIKFCKTQGLRVFLKPVIEVRNGSCRADIDFMENDEFDKEQWLRWLANYQKFILHYAKIAEKTQCELFFVGSCLLNLVQYSEGWFDLIAQVRSCYHGLVTYEADIYNEQNVGFWEELDVIATNGSYSMLYLKQELERLGDLAKQYKKPLMLTECGCMSTKGASVSPKSWKLDGEQSLEEQVMFYENLFSNCSQVEQIAGLGLWCWNNRRQSEHTAKADKRYFIYGKPACKVIHGEWSKSSVLCIP